MFDVWFQSVTPPRGSATLSTTIGATSKVIGKAYIIIGTVYIITGKAFIIIGKAYIIIGKVYIVIGRAYIIIGKAYIVIGRAYIIIGKAYIIIGRAYIIIGKAYIIIGKAPSLKKMGAQHALRPPCRVLYSFLSNAQIGYWLLADPLKSVELAGRSIFAASTAARAASMTMSTAWFAIHSSLMIREENEVFY